MGVLTPAALRDRLAAGDVDQVYLVLGGDEREKAELADALAATVEEGARAFDVDRFQGGEVDLGTVVAAARTAPMLAARRVVIVAHAERALHPAGDRAAARRGLDELDACLQAPVPQTALMFVAGDLDPRRRITQRLRACATVVSCGDLADAAAARAWIRDRMTAAGKQIDAAAVGLLVEAAGPDAARLRGQVDRLLLYAGDRSTITGGDVRTLIGTTVARAADDWAVARAIEQGAAGRALRELGLALDAGAAPYMVLGQLAWVARSRLDPAGTAAAIDAVFRTDLALKQSQGEPRVLLERLVVDLCRAAAPPSRRRWTSVRR